MLMMLSSALAQTTYEDVVYLKNGSVIHGMIIEQVPNRSIKIQTTDRNVFVYNMDEVEKITKEAVLNSDRGQGQAGATGSFKEKGYLNITEVSLGVGLGQASEDLSYGIQTVNGVLINPNFSLGLGIGVDKYKFATFVPIFADIRAYFLRSDVTPYFVGAIGYSLSFDSGSKGGLFVNPSLGVRFTVSPKAALDFSLGYRLQQSTYEFSSFGYSGGYVYPLVYTYKASADLFNFKVGASF